jgi:uncharacterized membrane protein YozB (DUF420 family)
VTHTSESEGPLRSTTPAATTWWRRPWVVPAMIIAFAFLVVFVPPYLTLDPTQSRLPLRADVPLHYPLLVAHVVFGTIAMATVPFQLWPKLRRKHPRFHRINGRVHVLAGVVPSGLLALAITPFAQGPAGNAIGGLLWLAATVAGFRAARQKRFADHRKWMIYSFALCMQIIEGRIMVLTIPLLPGYNPASFPLLLETASWIGVLLNLIAAQWWLDRTSGRRAQRRRLPETPARKAVTR